MNILILGNGFDLAHGLPTRYKDFLDFTKMLMLGIEAVYEEEFDSFVDSQVFKSINNDVSGYIDGLLSEYRQHASDGKEYIYFMGEMCKTNSFKWYYVNCNQETRAYEYKEKKSGTFTVDVFDYMRLLDNNYWLFHFYETTIKSNWVDFETEIAQICSLLEKKIGDLRPNVDNVVYFDFTDPYDRLFKEYFLDSEGAALTLEEVQKYIERHDYHALHKIEGSSKRLCNYSLPVKFLFMIRDSLVDSLERLTLAFELYLINVVERCTIEKNHLFEELCINKVLSFNYTHTCMLYGLNDVEFVHGQVRNKGDLNSKKLSPLVLGMNESLEEAKSNDDTNCIRFKKYYQRIRKNAGGDYKRWSEYLQFEDALKSGTIGSCYDYYAIIHKREKRTLYNRASHPEEIKTMFDKYYAHNIGLLENGSCVYVFGHSLDITDGDVLRQFIDYDNIKVVIFYYNEKDLDDKIEHLVKIIGRQKLIRRRGSKRQSIYFRNISTGEII